MHVHVLCHQLLYVIRIFMHVFEIQAEKLAWRGQTKFDVKYNGLMVIGNY
jgi:hypothetical protein